VLLDCGLVGIVPAWGASAASPQRLHFARGTTTLSVRGHINGNQRRFYILRTRARQHLRISAVPDRKDLRTALVPLIFVTPPGGKYDGDKTADYTTKSSRAGDYRIEVAANKMASNGDRGDFILRVTAK
jgi:hypothetical protein